MKLQYAKGLVISKIIAALVSDILADQYTEVKETISVGVFTNLRECGYTFKVFREDGEMFTWCVYEHRNTDSIIINGVNRWVSSNGDLPYMADSKSQYLDSFNYNEHYKCAEALTNMMVEFLQGAKKSDS